MNSIIISIALVALIIGTAVYFIFDKSGEKSNTDNNNNNSNLPDNNSNSGNDNTPNWSK